MPAWSVRGVLASVAKRIASRANNAVTVSGFLVAQAALKSENLESRSADPRCAHLRWVEMGEHENSHL